MLVESTLNIILVFPAMIGILYIYSLYNLYIGRKVNIYKTVILGINFLALILFILFLAMTDYSNVQDRNIAVFIILSIIVLTVIVLGIIGGFMHDKIYSLDKTEQYANQVITVKKILFGLSGVILVLYIGVWITLWVR